MRQKNRTSRAVRGEYAVKDGAAVERNPDTECNEQAAAGRTYCIMAIPPEGAQAGSMDVVTRPVPCGYPEKRKRTGVLRSGIRAAAGLILTAAVMASPVWLTTGSMLPVTKQLSAASAMTLLPLSSPAAGVSSGDVVQQETVTTAAAVTTTTTSATQTVTSTTAGTTTAASTAAESTEGLLPVTEQKLGNSGVEVTDGVYVRNSTGYSPDFEELLSERAKCKIKLNAGYQVLIMHTHTTECYAQRSDGLYSPEYSPRTTDHAQSVVAVGEVLAGKLEAAGIRTLHAVEMHDYPRYNGSYDRALETISKYLEEYPSIEMVIDVHRDAITYDSGAKLKPTAVINGRKTAQVMIISGCDAGGSLYFPGWKNNLVMALQIQQAAQNMYPGLMRPVYFAPYRYNMHMTPNSLLMEFGTDVNTLDEALYAAEMAGDALVEVLMQYVVG